ncbi:MAG: TRAP transporter large permease subunit [Burkholderiales bacterium]|nr:TRAP transporter large permease subunit [Burkholderiales bacterium]
MPSGGLWMLLALAVAMITTGLPVWTLLVGVAGLFAALGVAAGAFDTGVLQALYPRIQNLLENDLLQAMPLYVFLGVLLQRLPVADALFRAIARLLRGTGAGPSLAALGVGALLAPMNGSVASSSSLLSRLVAPRLGPVSPARGVSLISAAATIGVVVPPSLVLLLLGDAMMNAHTEASHLAAPGAAGYARIINTQDVLNSALLPAAAVLALWVAIAWWQGRREAEGPPLPRLGLRDAVLAAAAALGVITLLTGVFLGLLLPVEAAATGGCVLVVLALVARALDRAAWRAVLEDSLALSGALFALLVGATSFSLVFSVFGTGTWLAQATLASRAPPAWIALLLLAGVGACAWVLDAFEMIFVIMPVVAPLLILRLGDAQQAAVLLLLVLQLSFLLPPLGYAVLMARSLSGLPRVATRTLLGAMAPFAAAQLLVVGAVFLWPALVHRLDAPAPAPSAAPAESEQDLMERMREMGPPPDDGPPLDAPAAPAR